MTQLELSQVDVPTGPEATRTTSPRKTAIVRGLTAAAIVVLSGFLIIQGRKVWLEWTMLQQQINGFQDHAFVGYPDIAPRISYAKSPPNWYQDDGKETLLWSRWEQDIGHIWFRLAPGDIDKARLLRSNLEVVSRPIDTPVVESDGGAVWRRIPPSAPVVSHTLGKLRCVYPVFVLSKVQVINDVVEDHPFLIMINAMAPADTAVSIFEGALNGRRVTMEPSGYFNDRRPLLFDRGTESLWIEDGAALKSLAGKYKGQELPLVAKPVPLTWVSSLAKTPRCRLVVGADRSRAKPVE
jgi:hypothetical protein